VADFGLARFAEKEGKVEVWGTPYYIAPEKARQIQEDFRSDMYSLGATLFHALAGQAPFEGDDSETVMALAQSEPTPDVRTFRPDLSAGCAAVIARMMHKDPDQRFATYDEAIEALASVREGRAPPVPPPHPPPPPGWLQRWLGGRPKLGL
jgi:serine/threonine protein kinase